MGFEAGPIHPKVLKTYLNDELIDSPWKYTQGYKIKVNPLVQFKQFTTGTSYDNQAYCSGYSSNERSLRPAATYNSVGTI